MLNERLALRRTSDGVLDDVEVRQVSTFRAEMMDDNRFWLCCCLQDTRVENDRIAFDITAVDEHINFEVSRSPTTWYGRAAKPKSRWCSARP